MQVKPEIVVCELLVWTAGGQVPAGQSGRDDPADAARERLQWRRLHGDGGGRGGQGDVHGLGSERG